MRTLSKGYRAKVTVRLHPIQVSGLHREDQNGQVVSDVVTTTRLLSKLRTSQASAPFAEQKTEISFGALLEEIFLWGTLSLPALAFAIWLCAVLFAGQCISRMFFRLLHKVPFFS